MPNFDLKVFNGNLKVNGDFEIRNFYETFNWLSNPILKL